MHNLCIFINVIYKNFSCIFAKQKILGVPEHEIKGI